MTSLSSSYAIAVAMFGESAKTNCLPVLVLYIYQVKVVLVAFIV